MTATFVSISEQPEVRTSGGTVVAEYHAVAAEGNNGPSFDGLFQVGPKGMG